MHENDQSNPDYAGRKWIYAVSAALLVLTLREVVSAIPGLRREGPPVVNPDNCIYSNPGEIRMQDGDDVLTLKGKFPALPGFAPQVAGFKVRIAAADGAIFDEEVPAAEVKRTAVMQGKAALITYRVSHPMRDDSGLLTVEMNERRSQGEPRLVESTLMIRADLNRLTAAPTPRFRISVESRDGGYVVDDVWTRTPEGLRLERLEFCPAD